MSQNQAIQIQSSTAASTPKINLVYTDKDKTSTASIEHALRRTFGQGTVKTITPNLLKLTSAEKLAQMHFILPGVKGDHCDYDTQIDRDTLKLLFNAVSEGLHITGFCAGAYYLARTINYNPPWDWDGSSSEVEAFNFINTAAYGPIPELARQPNKHDRSADVTTTKIEYYGKNGKKSTITVAYGNGPYFTENELPEGTEILARYADIPGKPIAAIRLKIGSGSITLSGMLPYEDSIEVSRSHNWKHIREISDALKPDEAERRKFFKSLIGAGPL